MKIKKEWLWAYLFIAPMVLGILTFSIGPILYTSILSLTDYDLLAGFQKFVGFGNFKKIFEGGKIGLEIRNTLVFAFTTVFLKIAIALVIANLLCKGIRAKGFFRTVYFMPNIAMTAAVVIVWKWLLNSKYGIVNMILGALSLPEPVWLADPNYAMLALIIISVWSGVGYKTVILLAAVQGISQEMYESAELDGANGFVKFFKITLPLTTPTIFFLMTMGIMKASQAFDLMYLFAGNNFSAATPGGPLIDAIRTIVFGVYTTAFFELHLGEASAGAVILLGIVLVLTAIQFKLQNKWVYYD